MEKLIELLNEREKTVNWVQHPWWCKEHLKYQCHWPRVINKKFWFIKWLVDNDKIDQDTKFLISANVENQKNGMWYVHTFDEYGSLLMLLAIQDEPIEFLYSILK